MPKMEQITLFVAQIQFWPYTQDHRLKHFLCHVTVYIILSAIMRSMIGHHATLAVSHTACDSLL